MRDVSQVNQTLPTEVVTNKSGDQRFIKNSSTSQTGLWVGSQAAYTAMTTWDPNTLYVITGQ